ncbi:MAG: 3-oxoacyl-ACP synthase III [Bradymonadaceae bacterium]
MYFENVCVLGLGRVDAPQAITSSALEDRLGPALEKARMQRGLLYGLTGIEERRFWDEGVQPSTVAARAGAKALADAGIEGERVGVLVSTSVCKDYVEPSVASLVHGLLGLPAAALNFDVGNACLGFLNGMHIVGDMIERGHIDYGLVVDGESSRFVVERTIERLLEADADPATLRNQLATLTLGSGAVAMVLARRDQHPEGHRLVGGVALAATEYSDLCRGQVDYMETNAGMLLIRGLELAERTFGLAQEELGWHPDVLDLLAVHQVSAVHTARFTEKLNLDLDKVYKIYPHFGNVGPASIPLVLSMAREEGRLLPGHRIALMGIGSGLNCSMMEMIW